MNPLRWIAGFFEDLTKSYSYDADGNQLAPPISAHDAVTKEYVDRQGPESYDIDSFIESKNRETP